MYYSSGEMVQQNPKMVTVIYEGKPVQIEDCKGLRRLRHDIRGTGETLDQAVARIHIEYTEGVELEGRFKRPKFAHQKYQMVLTYYDPIPQPNPATLDYFIKLTNPSLSK